MNTIQRTRNAVSAFRQPTQAFRILALCAFLALGSLCGSVHAAVPQTINYQGNLTNLGGTPISSAVVMTFRLYNVASGGAALWTETQLSVNVANGIFDAVLGSVTPLTLPFDVPYWLTVAINSDGEMSPRRPLTASPYALRAATADTISTISSDRYAQRLQVTYDLAAGAVSPPIEVPANLPVALTGVQLQVDHRGVAQATLLSIPGVGGFIEWTGLESTAGSIITQGYSGVQGTHIVFLDYNHVVDVEVNSPTTIRIHNESLEQRSGVVTLTW